MEVNDKGKRNLHLKTHHEGVEGRGVQGCLSFNIDVRRSSVVSITFRPLYP